MNEEAARTNLVELATGIVSAYVSHNSVRISELPALIAEVHRALNGTHGAPSEPEPEPLKAAVNPKKSVFPDYIVCLEDGKKFKSLKRHLRTHHNLAPEEYRQKWGLAHDYPMVAPNYAAQRSEFAKKIGLGRTDCRIGRMFTTRNYRTSNHPLMCR